MDDIFYGADCELRVGLRADLETAPTAWQSLEFVSLSVNPTQEQRERPKLGVPGSRHNALDPVAPRPGFFRLPMSLVIDADSRQLPIWLLLAMGDPATEANGDLYDHVWSSGSKAERYFDLQLKVGASDVRIYEAITLGALSLQYTGENTQDFDITLALTGLRRRTASAFEGGSPTACPAEAPILRGLFLVDEVAADNMLSASFNYDRGLAEGIFLSATPTVSSNKPGKSAHTGSCSFRAVGGAFDELEVDGDPFGAGLDMIGVEEDHRILFEHPQAILAPSPLPIGPDGGMIERTFSWTGHQSSSTPATRITVTNDVATYTDE